MLRIYESPRVLTLSRDDWGSPLVGLLCDAMAIDEPGQAAVLDLLITAVLKAWFARQEADRPAWWRHQGDRIVEHALRLMHDHPAHTWTLAALASEAGASRAALARRFHDLMGEPPMTFLKHWRMALAADLLCRPEATVSHVAEQVGYATPYAFSTAFKQVRGISPAQFRGILSSTELPPHAASRHPDDPPCRP